MSTVALDTITATLSADGTALDVKRDWQLTIDETWSPYVQGYLEIAGLADVSKIDPRKAPRVKIRTVHRTSSLAFLSDYSSKFGGKVGNVTTFLAGGKLSTLSQYGWMNSTSRKSSARTWNLYVRSRTVRKDGSIRIAVESDESLAQDIQCSLGIQSTNLQGFVDSTLGFLQANSANTFARSQLDTFDATMPVGQNPASPTTPYQYGDNTDYFSFLQRFADVVGARVWCDETRVWHVGPNPFATAPLTLALATGAAGTITDYTDQISRDDNSWGDAYFCQFTWTDSAGLSRSDAAGYNPAPYTPQKWLREQFDNITAPWGTDAFARDAYAQAKGIRAKARGRNVPAVAIANFLASPGVPVTIGIPTAPALAGTIRAVTFQGNGEMSIVTRDLQEV